MKNKQPLKSGSIVRVKLECGLGYAYGKVINIAELLNSKLSVDSLVYFYDHVTLNSENNDFTEIHNKELLVGPLFVLDLKPVVKNGTWTQVGHVEPKTSELGIPDFKEARPLATWDEDKATGWGYIRNLNVNGRVLSEWEKVKHLEEYQYSSHDLVARRLTMEYIRQSGKKIEDYYKLKEWKESSVYKNLKYTPIYSSIPKRIRGRAID